MSACYSEKWCSLFRFSGQTTNVCRGIKENKRAESLIAQVSVVVWSNDRLSFAHAPSQLVHVIPDHATYISILQRKFRSTHVVVVYRVRCMFRLMCCDRIDRFIALCVIRWHYNQDRRKRNKSRTRQLSWVMGLPSETALLLWTWSPIFTSIFLCVPAIPLAVRLGGITFLYLGAPVILFLLPETTLCCVSLHRISLNRPPKVRRCMM